MGVEVTTVFKCDRCRHSEKLFGYSEYHNEFIHIYGSPLLAFNPSWTVRRVVCKKCYKQLGLDKLRRNDSQPLRCSCCSKRGPARLRKDKVAFVKIYRRDRARYVALCGECLDKILAVANKDSTVSLLSALVSTFKGQSDSQE